MEEAIVVALSGDKYKGSVDIPSSVEYSGNTYSVTAISEWCFEDCTSLTNIIIPNSVTSLGEHCFHSCTSLTSITIPNSVTSLSDYCIYNCTSLTNITIPEGVTSLGDDCFENCKSLTNIIIPNSVTSLGECCFEDCTSLTNIIIPEGVTYIGDDCFKTCNKLIWIKLLCNESLATGSDGNHITYNRHREVYNNEIYYVKDGYSIQGLAPKTPANIQYSLENKKTGDVQNITWDSNNNPISTRYDLYFYQNEQWVAINSLTETSFVHNIPIMDNSNNCKYRIRAYLNGLYSDWCEGEITFSVVGGDNNYIQINGEDSYLGKKLNKFSISYSIKINKKGE